MSLMNLAYTAKYVLAEKGYKKEHGIKDPDKVEELLLLQNNVTIINELIEEYNALKEKGANLKERSKIMLRLMPLVCIAFNVGAVLLGGLPLLVPSLLLDLCLVGPWGLLYFSGKKKEEGSLEVLNELEREKGKCEFDYDYAMAKIEEKHQKEKEDNQGITSLIEKTEESRKRIESTCEEVYEKGSSRRRVR